MNRLTRRVLVAGTLTAAVLPLQAGVRAVVGGPPATLTVARAAASDPDTRTVTFPGHVSTADPCTTKAVATSGPTDISIDTDKKKSGDLAIVVHISYRGTATGVSQELTGRDTFTAVATQYDIPYRMTTEDGTAEFHSGGIVRISADATNAPTGASIQTLVSNCIVDTAKDND